MTADLVLDALEMAIWQRRRTGHDLRGLVHHSDAGSQYTSIRYTERLAEAGARPSIGSVGDSYDNALAESIIGLFKTELIRRKGPWRGWTLSRWPRWNGLTGSTIGGSSPPSATFHRSKPKPTTTSQQHRLKSFRWQKPASTEPGAVHLVARLRQR
jgi:transposase InsO family protein